MYSMFDDIDSLDFDFNSFSKKDIRSYKKELKKLNHEAKKTRKIVSLFAKRLATNKKFWIFTTILILIIKFKIVIELAFAKLVVMFVTAATVTQAVLISTAVSTAAILTISTNETSKTFVVNKINELFNKNENVDGFLLEKKYNAVNIDKNIITKDLIEELNKTFKLQVKQERSLKIKKLDSHPQTKKGNLVIIQLLSGQTLSVDRYYQDETDEASIVVIDNKSLQKKRVKIYEIKTIKIIH